MRRGGEVCGRGPTRREVNAEGSQAGLGGLACGRCDPTLRRTGQTLDLDFTLPGNETSVEQFEGCTASAVERWTIHEGGHSPYLTSNWPSAIYGFVSAHPKPAERSPLP